MEKQFNRVSLLTLKELAVRRVVVLLWNAPQNLVRIRRFTSSNPRHLPKDWGDSVSHALSKLQLPESLAKQMKRISEPVGLQIIRWKLYHEDYLDYLEEYFDAPILEKLQWTAAGAVDYRKTAEELVRCDIFDIEKRYKLACLYCLDHYISDLWEELPQESKISFYSEVATHRTVLHLHYCWPYILKGKEYKLNSISRDSNSFNEFAFQRSSIQGNTTASEYFLRKLTLEEREKSIMSAAKSALTFQKRNVNPSFPDRNISDVVFYLISEMTPEQQAEIFRERPTEVFGCFFDWPWQDVFLDFSETMWTWMQCEDLECRAKNYDRLLDEMYTRIEVTDYCLPNLYKNIFMSSPSDFRKHFVERECLYGSFLTRFFFSRDTETTSVVFSYLDAEDKLRLVSAKCLFTFFHCSVSIGKGDRLKMFLRATGLSKEDKVRLKEYFKDGLAKIDSRAIESEIPKWSTVFEFLDETDQVKRNSQPETFTETKKLCCERK